jgi:signal transduction histidine kinase
VLHLNQVLNVSEAKESGREVVVLDQVIAETIDSIALLAQNAAVNIYNETPQGIQLSVVPAYLESIILNFLTNGIKYKSSERSAYIKINAYKKDRYVVITFEDNGLGMDLNTYGQKLFGMYKTFHDNQDAQGIGLFITKNQVEAMQGRMEVESREGVGTTFSVYLPALRW